MRLLREPLLHFAVAGALLFGAYSWLNRHETQPIDADHTIRITERELTWLKETSARTFQRTPSDSELELLISEYLREEMLAREARELELDRDDTIIRRRLGQKMNFILENTARLATPNETDLRALYDANRERFRTPGNSSFRQVFFSTDKRGERATSDASAALGKLTRKTGKVDESSLGDPTLLPPTLDHADEAAITRAFGADFARAVASTATGSWQGPISSEFGVHLIFVSARDESRLPAFEEVRAQLTTEWQREQEAKAKNAYFAGLLRKYDIQGTASTQPLVGPALSLLTGTGQ